MHKKNKCKQICSMLMVLMIILTSLPFGRMEAEAATEPVKIKVTYGQTEARAMLDDINAFRTSDKDAWCWDMSDSTKQSYLTTELKYDYELERVAMQRAAEIALSYDHTRPDDSSCFTAYPSGYTVWGENIAAGYSSAAEVFNGWKEENEHYAGQGHRRNMLSDKFKAVGIGHVVYQGCHYWVQEFGDTVKSETDTGVNDDTQIVDVDVASSYITAVKTNLDDVSLKVGEKTTAADFSLALNVKNQWGYQKDCVIENTCSAKIEDETIASLSDDAVITGLKSGTTKIWISNPFGDVFCRTITVTESKENSADKPNTNNKDNTDNTDNKDNTDNTDNTDNIDNTDISIDAIPDQTYTGSVLTPKVVVKDGSKVLTQNADYTVSYSNNINAGIATVTIMGIDSYEGTIGTTFQITSRSIGEVTVEKIDDQKYTGRELTPKLNLTYKGKLLTENVDYVAVYSNNIEPGNGVVNIQGKGNFSGQRKQVFSIKKKSQSVENDDKDHNNQDEIIHTTTMKLGKTKITLKKGQTYRLKVKVNAGSTDRISYKSSNKKIAVVSRKGVIRAKKAGKVSITVKSGNITKRCVLVVKKGKNKRTEK